MPGTVPHVWMLLCMSVDQGTSYFGTVGPLALYSNVISLRWCRTFVPPETEAGVLCCGGTPKAVLLNVS